MPSLVGIDLVEPERLRERLGRTRALGAELFTAGELSYCQSCSHPEEHLAARFAAKEAVIKALGIDGFDPLDIEVVGGSDSVSLRLHGPVATRAEALGVDVTVSLTHLAGVAAAVALAIPASARWPISAEGARDLP